MSCIDVHCHIVETDNLSSIESKTMEFWVMGTRPTDWHKVLELQARFPDRIIPCFGIHPWFSQNIKNEDLVALENYISTTRSIVGEIGLDRVAKDFEKKLYPIETQLKLFELQMSLATNYQRPVSIHGVQSHGILMNYFKQLDAKSEHPPAIMMHSYSSSVEMLKYLINLDNIGNKFYFSYSNIINSRSPKFQDRILATPDDRLLIESDVHNIDMVDDQMQKIVEIVAKVKQWTIEETIAKTVQNSKRFSKFL